MQWCLETRQAQEYNLYTSSRTKSHPHIQMLQQHQVGWSGWQGEIFWIFIVLLFLNLFYCFSNDNLPLILCVQIQSKQQRICVHIHKWLHSLLLNIAFIEHPFPLPHVQDDATQPDRASGHAYLGLKVIFLRVCSTHFSLMLATVPSHFSICTVVRSPPLPP